MLKEEERASRCYLAQFHREAQEYEQYTRRLFFERVVSGQLSVQQIYEAAGKLDIDLRAQCYNIAFFSVPPEHPGSMGAYRNQFVVVYRVEILFNVQVYNPLVSLVQIFQCLAHCCVAVSVWPEPIAVFAEIPLVPPRQYLGSSLLYHPVHHCGYS